MNYKSLKHVHVLGKICDILRLVHKYETLSGADIEAWRLVRFHRTSESAPHKDQTYVWKWFCSELNNSGQKSSRSLEFGCLLYVTSLNDFETEINVYLKQVYSILV